MDAVEAKFQESLPLRPTEEFRASVDIEMLAVDPELAEALVRVGPLCFLDFEATGLDPAEDALIEVGAVTIEPGSTSASVFNSFIHVQRQLTPFIKRLTGITDDDLRNAPTIEQIGPALNRFIGDTPIVAHNADFERSWLTRAVDGRFGEHPFLDTLDLLALVYPDSPNMKLDTFCRRQLKRKERHRALDDALDTLRVVAHVVAESRRGSPAAANASAVLRRFDPQSPWKARLDAALPAELRARDLSRPRPAPAAREQILPVLAPVAFDRREIARRLADPAAGAACISGYQPRTEQIDLMERVFDTFTGKGGKTVHICEAGTGIGKTLAYLSVAIPFARKTGERVVISTSSKLLQSQLIEKDIPAAARLLGYPDLRFTSIKGRANYLCRARLQGFLDDIRLVHEPGEERPLSILAAFSLNASHGEVDRIPTVLHQMNPRLEGYLREVTSADATECSRATCETAAGDCVFRSARRRLEGAEIAVTNHDLLLRWPSDYPPLVHLIVDEIHELAERADGAYASSASAVEILHRIESVTGDKGACGVGGDPQMLEDARRATELIAYVGRETRMLAGSSQPARAYRDDLPLPLAGPGPAWSGLIDACGELAERLDGIGRRLSEIADADEGPIAGAADAMLDAASVLRVSFPKPPARLVVRFTGLGRPSPNSWRLLATPVSPAADFQCEVLDQVESLFGTSATVGVGADGLGSIAGLELDQTAGARFRLSPPIESPFDYANHLEVVFLSDPVTQSQLVERTATAIATVARRLHGRTMALFTSRDRLNTVAERLDETLGPLGISIVAPAAGSADPHELVRTFLESDGAVLLGARAFWQGVDVPGDACQALVIEKLPFDVPGDPLLERRAALIEQEGGHAFGDFSMPRMLLRFKQMVGRLIRTPTDKGIIVVVDPRSDKSYFKRLHDALPAGTPHVLLPAADLDATVEAFFGRHASASASRPPPSE